MCSPMLFIIGVAIAPHAPRIDAPGPIAAFLAVAKIVNSSVIDYMPLISMHFLEAKGS